MPRPFFGLVVAAAFLGASASQADKSVTLTQRMQIDRADDVYGLVVNPDRIHRAHGDRHLSLDERIELEPVDPSLGQLQRVRLEMEIVVAHRFSAVVGDGMPLDEKPEAVAGQGGLTSRIDLVAPGGMFVYSETVATEQTGCASSGACAFEQREGTTLRTAFAVPMSAFTDAMSPTLTLRATGTGGVLSQVCRPSPAWERCHVDHAQLLIRTRGPGIAVHYDYVPAAVALGSPAFGSVMRVLLDLAAVLALALVAWLFVTRLRRRRAAPR